MLRRNRIGVQAGGSSVFQVVYRLRIVGPVHVEAGLLGAPEGPINGSLGMVVAVPRPGRFFPYAGYGVGLVGVPNIHGARPCSDSAGCPTTDDALRYIYARAGVGVALGRERRQTLELDLGGWWGYHTSTLENGSGTRTSSSKTFLWPTAGLSYFFAF